MNDFRSFEDLLNEFKKKLPPGPSDEEMAAKSVPQFTPEESDAMSKAVGPELGDAVQGEPMGPPTPQMPSPLDDPKLIGNMIAKEPKNFQAPIVGKDLIPPDQLPIGVPPINPAAAQNYAENNIPNPKPPINPAADNNYKENARPDAPEAAKQMVNDQTKGSEPSGIQKTLEAYRNLASERSTGLREAQQQSNDNDLYANLVRAAKGFTAGVTAGGIIKPATIDYSGIDAMIKSGNKPVTQYNEQVADQKHDPSSKYSQIMREYLAPKLIEQEKGKLDPNLSAEDKKAAINQIESKIRGSLTDVPGDVLEKISPQISKDIYNDHLGSIKKSLDENKQREKDQDQQMKLDKEFDDNVLKFNDKLDKPELQGSRSAAGKNVLISQFADRINVLMKSAPKGDYNNLTNQQVYEIAKSLDAMLSLGAPTVVGTKSINPESIKSIIAGYDQKLANKPVGAQLGAFVSNIGDTITREKAQADKQIGSFYDVVKGSIPERQYKQRKSDYDKSIDIRLKRIGLLENPKVAAALGSESSAPAAQAAPGAAPALPQAAPNEIKRFDPKSGKTVVYDANKKFLRFE